MNWLQDLREWADELYAADPSNPRAALLYRVLDERRDVDDFRSNLDALRSELEAAEERATDYRAALEDIRELTQRAL